jgi:hypothetical protein
VGLLYRPRGVAGNGRHCYVLDNQSVRNCDGAWTRERQLSPESWLLFHQEHSAPLNIVERTLMKAILHRKNARFYKTMHGALVGDLFMSLIHACEFNKVNPFDYFTELLGIRRSSPCTRRIGGRGTACAWQPP